MNAQKLIDELMTAFVKYCEDKQDPIISDTTRNFIGICLKKAEQIAKILEEEPSIYHHPIFILMLKKANNNPLFVRNFIIACAPKRKT